jgi:hypothetical protein
VDSTSSGRGGRPCPGIWPVRHHVQEERGCFRSGVQPGNLTVLRAFGVRVSVIFDFTVLLVCEMGEGCVAEIPLAGAAIHLRLWTESPSLRDPGIARIL